MPSNYKPFSSLALTYKLDNYPSHTRLPNDRIDSAIWQAFVKWQAVSPFTFRKMTTSDPGTPGQSRTPDIVLRFGSVTKSDDAHAEANPATHIIVFNDERTWRDLAEDLRAKDLTTFGLSFNLAVVLVRGLWESVDALDTNLPDVLSIAVHEIGHVLGLEHSSDTSSVMQPTADYYKMMNVNGAPISQVDIDALKEANQHLFSVYYATHGVTNWFKRGEGFAQVSAGLDNTVWAIDKKGEAHEFGPSKWVGESWEWERRGENMRQIAVFSAHLVLGVTKDLNLKLYRPQHYDPWVTCRQNIGLVAAGADGSVWVVQGPGLIFRIPGGRKAF